MCLHYMCRSQLLPALCTMFVAVVCPTNAKLKDRYRYGWRWRACPSEYRSLFGAIYHLKAHYKHKSKKPMQWLLTGITQHQQNSTNASPCGTSAYWSISQRCTEITDIMAKDKYALNTLSSKGFRKNSHWTKAIISPQAITFPIAVLYTTWQRGK